MEEQDRTEQTPEDENEEVEAHKFKHRNDEGEDVEGHGWRKSDEGDDVEAHGWRGGN